ncbi:hypothetical protein Q7C36_022883 [Tachysurus vachellii]|uniref:CRIB domain-containing protein n=1 Tax=Tachysurus vachellii TaxID=175792 RepID=A0AA88IHL6_TACVA|nr:hypothetical protein Q7C36_022883 [Tachysurus vachellii]
MSSKAPIYLKRRSRKGKKEKLRDLLSSDMISPPLGDFRHTIHIGSGSGGDNLFGDLSFLQGKFHLLPGQQAQQGAIQWSCPATRDLAATQECSFAPCYWRSPGAHASILSPCCITASCPCHGSTPKTSQTAPGVTSHITPWLPEALS